LSQREAAQTGLARSISMASPLADFSYLATDLSSTGTENMIHFGWLWKAWESAFYRDYQTKKLEALKAKDPTADLWNTPIDMTDSPRFRYMEEGLGGRVKAVLPPFAVLLGYCAALFAAAYVAFIRYDAR
jgi:hypothetical protein